MMARLVSVLDPELNHKNTCEFQRRQLPVEVDNVKMVMQLSDKCTDCRKLNGVKQKDLDAFAKKFNSLSKDELASALKVPRRDFLSHTAQSVPCVGCRKSVEQLCCELQASQQRALEPLMITPKGEISLQTSYMTDPRSLFSLFHIHGSKLHAVMDAIPTNKKNKRCNLHSIDSHKAKTLDCALEAWESLAEPCRESLLVLDACSLSEDVEAYLKKYRFCTDCRASVLLAYDILTGDAPVPPASASGGFSPSLYSQLTSCSCCPGSPKINVDNDPEFITYLLEKVECEFKCGSRRERHAKTLEIAQGEVLTCVGIHLFERLHRVWLALKGEEQAWRVLFHTGVDALHRSFQAAVEKSGGDSALEALCQELEAADRKQAERKELKRMKKKQRRAKSSASSPPSSPKSLASRECSPEAGEPPCHCPSLNDNADKCDKNNQNSQLKKKIVFDFDQSNKCQEELRNFNKESATCKRLFQSRGQPFLSDLLIDAIDDIDEPNDDSEGLSPEEIKAFKDQQGEVETQRLELRATLRQRFAQMQIDRRRCSSSKTCLQI